jgi:hypothetical protein
MSHIYGFLNHRRELLTLPSVRPITWLVGIAFITRNSTKINTACITEHGVVVFSRIVNKPLIGAEENINN